MDNRKKKYLMAIGIIVVILGGVVLFYQWRGQTGSKQKFRLVKVKRGDIRFVVTATGTINPDINVLVGSQVSGTIKALYADFNSQVKEGQVIAQIDPAIFAAQVEQGRANVLGAQANLLNAQSNLENAKANLTKAEVAVLDASTPAWWLAAPVNGWSGTSRTWKTTLPEGGGSAGAGVAGLGPVPESLPPQDARSGPTSDASRKSQRSMRSCAPPRFPGARFGSMSRTAQ